MIYRYVIMNADGAAVASLHLRATVQGPKVGHTIVSTGGAKPKPFLMFANENVAKVCAILLHATVGGTFKVMKLEVPND